MSKKAWILVFTGIFLVCLNSHGQRRKRNSNGPNWLEQKQAYESRIRYAGGFHLGQPTGIHLQFYKVRDICTSGITINKKVALDLSLGYEGFLYKEQLANQDSSWLPGGFRFGLDLKYHFPFIFNPYLSAGYEGGTRAIVSMKNFQSDLVFRLGGEQKVAGFRLSRNNSMIIRLFAEAKYNHCLTYNCTYLSGNFGLRFHVI